MAASRAEFLDIEPLHTSLEFWAYPPSESRTTDRDGTLTFSTSQALGGARAALVAIGLEAVAVVGCYSFAHLWRLLR